MFLSLLPSSRKPQLDLISCWEMLNPDSRSVAWVLVWMQSCCPLLRTELRSQIRRMEMVQTEQLNRSAYCSFPSRLIISLRIRVIVQVQTQLGSVLWIFHFSVHVFLAKQLADRKPFDQHTFDTQKENTLRTKDKKNQQIIPKHSLIWSDVFHLFSPWALKHLCGVNLQCGGINPAAGRIRSCWLKLFRTWQTSCRTLNSAALLGQEMSAAMFPNSSVLRKQ